MRRFAVLPVSLLFLIACSSSRHAMTQKTIGVQIWAAPAPVEYRYPPNVRMLADAIAADLAKTIGPVDMNPQPGTVPLVSVS